MSFDINGLNTYLDTTAVTSGSDTTEKLKNTGNASSPEELKEACREFESYFIEQIYKEMFKTIGKEDDDSSIGRLVDYFKDTAIQTLASQTTEQTGGPLAQKLYEQMKRNYGITDTVEE